MEDLATQLTRCFDGKPVDPDALNRLVQFCTPSIELNDPRNSLNEDEIGYELAVTFRIAGQPINIVRLDVRKWNILEVEHNEQFVNVSPFPSAFWRQFFMMDEPAVV